MFWRLAPFSFHKVKAGVYSLLLAIDLLELEALVAVAVALVIAIVVAGRGSAALLGELSCWRVPPRSPQLGLLTNV